MINPKIVVLFSSYRCDSRCIMCYAWEKQHSYPELSVAQIDKIFSDPVLSSSVKIVNLTGGEPTIRPDLVEIVNALIRRCKNLKRIDIPTNGINTGMVLDKIESVLTALLPTDVRLAVTVSLDGVDGVHEQVRGVPHIFNNIEKTIKGIKEMKEIWQDFHFGLNATINKINYNRLDELKKYGYSNGVGVNFTLGALSEIGVESIMMKEKFCLGENEKREVIAFFETNVISGEIDKNYADMVIGLLKSGKRKPLCAFRAKKSILIEPDGNTYLCGNYREFYIGNALRESFKSLAGNAKNIKRAAWNRCHECGSNCYIEEML